VVALISGWNSSLQATLNSKAAFDACVKGHFGAYEPPADCRGWMLGVAVLAESLPLCFCISDCQVAGFPLVYVNSKFSDVTGYSKLELCGRNCRFLQGPATNPVHGQMLLDTLRDGENSQIMMVNYRKSGEVFENLLTMAYVADSLGRRRFCVGLQVDLTGLQDDSGPWGRRNLGTKEGKAQIETLRKNMSKLIKLLPLDIQVEAPPEGSTEKPTGHWGPRAAGPVLTREGELSSCPELEALAESLHLPMVSTAGRSWVGALYALLDQAPHAIVVVDMTVPGLPLHFVNGAFMELTGHQAADVLGKNCRFLQCKQTEPKRLYEMIDSIRKRRPCQLQITNQCKDGTLFMNDLSLHPIEDSNGTSRLNVGILSDHAVDKSNKALEGIRASMPTVFEIHNQPSTPIPFIENDPIEQWKLYEPVTSRLMRMLWSTDGDGALRKLLTLPPAMAGQAISSLGGFLSKNSPEDEKLLTQVIKEFQAKKWHPETGRTASIEAPKNRRPSIGVAAYS